MAHYGKDLAFMLLVLALGGGLVVYGIITGRIPGRFGVVERDERPGMFYFGILVYTGCALFALYRVVDLILLMIRHNGAS